jgi:DNA-binding winged helix-turn-helix (wHTH) protein
MHIAIGECSFDPVRREVRRAGARVHLSPKAFELLGVLLESRPRAVSKDELFSRLWPDTFVTEASLAGLVAEIRREIADDARDPRFLRTVHGFGYAFSADGVVARRDDDDAADADGCSGIFRLIWGLREVPLGGGENILGREAGAAVYIDDSSVSRHHARIVIEGSRAILEDLGSKNGTWLCGSRIAGSRPLSDGDAIRIGSVPMTFRCFAPVRATETQRD